MRTAILGIVLACGVADADPKTDQCKADATTLGAFLASTPHDKDLFVSQRSVDLAVRTDLTTAVPIAPVITASRAETAMQGHVINGRADLMKGVKAAKASKAKYVVVTIDDAVAWSRVVEIVEVVTSQGLAPAFVFAVELVVVPPPRSAYDDGIAASKPFPPKPGQKTQSQVIDAILDPCPALRTLWRSMSGEGVDRTKTLLAGVTPALIACSCTTDLPSVRSLFWEIVVVRRTARAIVFDKPATEKLALPATTMWGDASKQLVPGKTYTFAVK